MSDKRVADRLLELAARREGEARELRALAAELGGEGEEAPAVREPTALDHARAAKALKRSGYARRSA